MCRRGGYDPEGLVSGRSAVVTRPRGWTLPGVLEEQPGGQQCGRSREELGELGEGTVGCCPRPQCESVPDSVRVAKVALLTTVAVWPDATCAVMQTLLQELPLGFLGIYLVI